MATGLGSTLGRMRAAWDASPALVVLTDGPGHTVVYQNPASRRLFGPRELGRPMDESFPEFSAEGRQAIKKVLAEGVTVIEEVPRPGVLGRHGSEVLLTFVFAPVLAEDERTPAGVLLTAMDVTSEVRTQRLAQQAVVLGELADRMNAAADPASAVRALVQGAVPAIADLAAVFVLPSWPATGSAQGRRPSSVIALSMEEGLLARVGLPPQGRGRGGGSPWDQPLAQGRPQLIDATDPDLVSDTEPAMLAWLGDARAHNLAVLPLAVAGQLVGALVLLSAGEREPYVPEDLAFLETVAARAGAAVTRVRDVAQQREIALELQHALLPPEPGTLGTLQVAARYQAGTAGVEIGGDWWDVHERADGTVGVGLGDVCGHGVHAAAVMGQLRAGMRTAALAGLGPSRILSLLDEQSASLADGPKAGGVQLATAVYGLIDPGAAQLVVANAGHPPLLLRDPDGRLSWVHAPPGLPLGMRLPDYAEITVPFPPGSQLIGFTDGLIESRSQSLQSGLDTLWAKVAALDPSDPVDDVADRLLAEMAELNAGQDDIALVVLHNAG